MRVKIYHQGNPRDGLVRICFYVDDLMDHLCIDVEEPLDEVKVKAAISEKLQAVDNPKEYVGKVYDVVV